MAHERASDEQQKLMKWLIQCEVIAGSASYIVNGYPETQVGVLRSELQAASADGVVVERW